MHPFREIVFSKKIESFLDLIILLTSNIKKMHKMPYRLNGDGAYHLRDIILNHFATKTTTKLVGQTALIKSIFGNSTDHIKLSRWHIFYLNRCTGSIFTSVQVRTVPRKRNIPPMLRLRPSSRGHDLGEKR